MEKKIFKKKLTISISSSSKKKLDSPKFSKGKDKNTLIVEKKIFAQELVGTDQSQKILKTDQVFN